jgi:hypothetical protein
MRVVARTAAFVLLLAFVAVAAAGRAQPGDKPAPRPGVSPGPVHQQMAKRAGQWTMVKKLSMPGQKPMEATGNATITSILGGRFLREENDGMLFGQPVAAEMMSGYDDDADRYEVVWGWTGANRLITATGKSEDGGRKIHYTSSYDSGKGKKEQIVIDLRTVDDDHFVVTLTSKLPDGKDGPTVETTYTRKT